MDPIEIFPNSRITGNGPVSEEFIHKKIEGFQDACRFVHQLPYGYNSDRDDLMILFKENKGSCTTKHAVIGTLAEELTLPVYKYIGIYAMTEKIVTGTDNILKVFDLPFIPMVHCFLVYKDFRIDLTDGNKNGKNNTIEEFFETRKVPPHLSAKNEYLIYRDIVQHLLSTHAQLKNIEMKRILKAREEGLKLLKEKVS